MTSPSPLRPAPFGSNSPCAACKFLRRKCQPDCIFAPYFKSDHPEKFVGVHRIFGASNVGKLLNEIKPEFREDAVRSLVYEAEWRIRDPVYGCVGVITALHQKLRRLQLDLTLARAELSCYQNAVTVEVPQPNFPVNHSGFFGSGAYDATEMAGVRLLDNGGGEFIGGGVTGHHRNF
ncbi:LOB domain-containing protein 6 [Platanthera guangdongensis]|uniref:LOB domain-containing protein 6 n=1 Tax=Platanthera guangdongensis TaxID=2320717 RepID=A0ABR2MA34_9ASPA